MEAQFEEVKELVRAKRYKEARQILVTMKHPKAERWLQRLDEVVPPKHPLMTAKAVVKPAVEEKPKGKPKKSDPRSPVIGAAGIAIFFLPVLTIPLMNVYLSLNWKRLGKPEWSAPALAATITAAVAFWFTIVLLITSPLTLGQASILVWVCLGGLNLWLYGVMLGLQSKAYKNWQAEGDEGLSQHVYPVGRNMLIWAVGIVVSIVGIFAYNAYQNAPRTFTDPTLSVIYDAKWALFDINLNPDCTSEAMDNDRRCVAIFQESQYGYTAVMILEEPNNMGGSLEQVDAALWRNMEASGTFKLQGQSKTTLDGQPTLVREYTFRATDGNDWYAMLMILFKGDRFYRVIGYSMNKGIFEEDRAAIQKLASVIQFTP